MSGHAPRPTYRAPERPDTFIRRLKNWEAVASSGTTTGDVKDPPSGGGGGAGPVPFSQTRAGLIFAGQQSRELLTIQRQDAVTLAKQQDVDARARDTISRNFERAQLQSRIDADAKARADERARERVIAVNQLRAERQGVFSQLMKSGDQARAVIFGLGFGPDNDVFDARARALGTTTDEIQGVSRARFGRTSTQAITERALSRVLGRGVTIGREGVIGLGSAVKSARAFAQGGTDIQDLLASAFGVGSLREGGAPGISPARFQELLKEVTPTGVGR